jgi:hypothetical protein
MVCRWFEGIPKSSQKLGPSVIILQRGGALSDGAWWKSVRSLGPQKELRQLLWDPEFVIKNCYKM